MAIHLSWAHKDGKCVTAIVHREALLTDLPVDSGQRRLSQGEEGQWFDWVRSRAAATRLDQNFFVDYVADLWRQTEEWQDGLFAPGGGHRSGLGDGTPSSHHLNGRVAVCAAGSEVEAWMIGIV